MKFNSAAGESILDFFFQLRLQHQEFLAQSRTEIEVATVERPDIHRYIQLA
jgi:hypothetical protein